MKKTIFILLSILLLIFTFPAITTSVMAAESYTLLSPTALTHHENYIYVADDATGQLLKYPDTQNPAAIGAQPTAKISLADIKKLVATENGILVLTKSTNETNLYLIDFNLANSTKVSFISSYTTESIIDFTAIGTIIYALQDTGDIDVFTISGSSLSRPDRIPKAHLQYIQDESLILNIDVLGSNLMVRTPSIIYFFNPDDGNNFEAITVTKELVLTSGETFLFTSGDYAITSTGRLVKVSVAETLKYVSKEVSGFYADVEHLYLSNKPTHQLLVFNCSQNTLTDLNINAEISLNYLSPKNFIQLKLTTDTLMYYKPYSITSTKVLPINSTINVVATYKNFYYCLIVENNLNTFLYLNKDSTTFEVIDAGTNDINFTATRTCNVYSLPSTIIDETNTVLGSVPASFETTILSASTISNTSGELFYLTKYNGTYGFIRSNFLQSTRGTVELTVPCNAKTKRTTTLFESQDGIGEIIELEKGTRIALLEETSPTKNYILAEYQDPKGVVYKGYILVEDVKTDGLSTLQILGLVLVGTNILLLTIIIIIKKRSKKWKVAPKDDSPSKTIYTIK